MRSVAVNRCSWPDSRPGGGFVPSAVSSSPLLLTSEADFLTRAARFGFLGFGNVTLTTSISASVKAGNLHPCFNRAHSAHAVIAFGCNDGLRGILGMQVSPRRVHRSHLTMFGREGKSTIRGLFDVSAGWESDSSNLRFPAPGSLLCGVSGGASSTGPVFLCMGNSTYTFDGGGAACLGGGGAAPN